MKVIDNNLGEQIAIVAEAFSTYLATGEVPAPYYPWRIAVILRRAKMPEAKRGFSRPGVSISQVVTACDMRSCWTDIGEWLDCAGSLLHRTKRCRAPGVPSRAELQGRHRQSTTGSRGAKPAYGLPVKRGLVATKKRVR